MTTNTTTIQAKANIHQPTTSIGIPMRMLNTKVNIIRKATSKDDTGDLDETFSVNQYNIPATIQPLSGDELAALQGNLYNYTDRMFLPKTILQSKNRINISIREGDEVYDQETAITYRTKLIEDMRPANRSKSGTQYHHYEIMLEKINDNRYAS